MSGAIRRYDPLFFIPWSARLYNSREKVFRTDIVNFIIKSVDFPLIVL